MARLSHGARIKSGSLQSFCCSSSAGFGLMVKLVVPRNSRVSTVNLMGTSGSRWMLADAFLGLSVKDARSPRRS